MRKRYLKPNKILNLTLTLCFVLNTFSTSALGALGPVIPTAGLQLPLLRYLSINSANPYNYFNFLLDKGLFPSATSRPDLASANNESVRSGLGNQVGTLPDLTKEAKKLINYFFLGISLSNDAFWVNLQPKDTDKMTSGELGRTDMGRVLLEQDLQLKKDVARYLHPDNTYGKIFWERLYTEIGKDKVRREKITTSQRVWIVPDTATVVETADGAFISEAKLKVLLETEYLQRGVAVKTKPLPGRKSKTEHRRGGLADRTPSNEESISNISEQLMKEIIIPELTFDVNHSSTYAPLRQIYYSLILAEYFKRKQAQGLSPQGTDPKNSDPYISLINQNTTQGLESELPWSKDKIFQEYLTSYQKGEYQIKRSLLGLARMYFSGGVNLAFAGSPVYAGRTNMNMGAGDIQFISNPDRAVIEIKAAISGNGDNFKLAMNLGNEPPGNTEVLAGNVETTGEAEIRAGSPATREEVYKIIDKLVDVVFSKIDELKKEYIGLKNIDITMHGSRYDKEKFSLSFYTYVADDVASKTRSHDFYTEKIKVKYPDIYTLLKKLFDTGLFGTPVFFKFSIDIYRSPDERKKSLKKMFDEQLKISGASGHQSESKAGRPVVSLAKALKFLMDLSKREDITDKFKIIPVEPYDPILQGFNKIAITEELGHSHNIYVPDTTRISGGDLLRSVYYGLTKEAKDAISTFLKEQESAPTPETKEGQQSASPLTVEEVKLLINRVDDKSTYEKIIEIKEELEGKTKNVVDIEILFTVFADILEPMIKQKIGGVELSEKEKTAFSQRVSLLDKVITEKAESLGIKPPLEVKEDRVNELLNEITTLEGRSVNEDLVKQAKDKLREFPLAVLDKVIDDLYNAYLTYYLPSDRPPLKGIYLTMFSFKHNVLLDVIKEKISSASGRQSEPKAGSPIEKLIDEFANAVPGGIERLESRTDEDLKIIALHFRREPKSWKNEKRVDLILQVDYQREGEETVTGEIWQDGRFERYNSTIQGGLRRDLSIAFEKLFDTGLIDELTVKPGQSPEEIKKNIQEKISQNPDSSLGGFAASPLIPEQGSDDSFNKGGIDLNAIKMELKNYASSPLGEKKELIGKFKTLLLIDALLDKKWFSLSHLYFQEIIRLVKDNIVSELDRDKLLIAAGALKAKGYLIDRQGLEFLKFLEAGKPVAEMRLLLSP